MTITYDTPIEVTKGQYNACMSLLQGVVAGKEAEGKYYIKVWLTQYNSVVEDILNKTK